MAWHLLPDYRTAGGHVGPRLGTGTPPNAVAVSQHQLGGPGIKCNRATIAADGGLVTVLVARPPAPSTYPLRGAGRRPSPGH
jgi:hypothetical protein